jgi:hypothetical protein
MFDPTTLLGFHTIISLIALGTGILAVLALLGLRLPAVWTQLFLLTAVATSATGFLFPVTAVLPSHIIGAIALVVLAAVLLARFVGHLAGSGAGSMPAAWSRACISCSSSRSPRRSARCRS